MTVTPFEPGFDLSVQLDRFDVPQGGKFGVPIFVLRRDYKGPIEVSVVGQGLTGTLTIPAARTGTAESTPTRRYADDQCRGRFVGRAARISHPGQGEK